MQNHSKILFSLLIHVNMIDDVITTIIFFIARSEILGTILLDHFCNFAEKCSWSTGRKEGFQAGHPGSDPALVIIFISDGYDFNYS